MGLITETVEVGLNWKNTNHFKDLGYQIPNTTDNRQYISPRKTKIRVNVNDLGNASKMVVQVKCDCCDKILNITWQIYLRVVKDDNKYYCKKCSAVLYGGTNISITRLKKGTSFEQWCIENNRQDILNRWDYELNKNNPNEINYRTSKKYYFKCPYNIHKSELKKIVNVTLNHEGSIDCKACNSFAQWGIDNICKDFLEMYWDYDKNINIDPWDISRATHKKVWIKCQEKDYHGSYDISCSNFTTKNLRCSYCSSIGGKVHSLDSLGKLLEDIGLLYLWSDKNKKTPYEYTPMSNQKVWWKCKDGKHEDFCRTIKNSNKSYFRCPNCSFSKGEDIIMTYLNQNKINYIPQKTFKGLIGVGKRLLSYDFYLPEYNLLIEYQGEFHDGSGDTSNLQTPDALEKQQEHDKRKKEYATKHSIKLLEIWYWNFDNIEKIIEEEIIWKEVS